MRSVPNSSVASGSKVLVGESRVALFFASLDHPFDTMSKYEVLTAGIVKKRVPLSSGGSLQRVRKDCLEIVIGSAAAHCQLVQYFRVREPVMD